MVEAPPSRDVVPVRIICACTVVVELASSKDVIANERIGKTCQFSQITKRDGNIAVGSEFKRI